MNIERDEKRNKKTYIIKKREMYVNKMNELEPDFKRFKAGKITGKRLFNEVTFNPSSANPGESIYVNIPNLGESMCLVPQLAFLNRKV